MPKHKRYCPDCGSLMDIRGECNAIIPGRSVPCSVG